MSKQAIFDQISPITLGTVQLGLDYGIANQRGKPDDAAGRTLLSRAVLSGIASFDTASQYGASESVLGQYFRDRDKPLIISKFKLSPAAGDNPDAVERDVRRQLEQSLNRLGLSSVSSLVIGSETAAQVEDNVRLLQGPAISADGRLAAQELFAHIPETILNPALWAK